MHLNKHFADIRSIELIIEKKIIIHLQLFFLNEENNQVICQYGC